MHNNSASTYCSSIFVCISSNFRSYRLAVCETNVGICRMSIIRPHLFQFTKYQQLGWLSLRQHTALMPSFESTSLYTRAHANPLPTCEPRPHDVEPMKYAIGTKPLRRVHTTSTLSETQLRIQNTLRSWLLVRSPNASAF